MIEPILTPLEMANIEDAVVIHSAAMSDSWNASEFSQLMATLGVFGLIAKTEGSTAVAFVLVRVVADEAEILTLATLPEHRRLGFASALMRKAATTAKALGAHSVFLEVARENKPALSLYAAHGFEKVGERKAYYKDSGADDSRDALILRSVL